MNKLSLIVISFLVICIFSLSAYIVSDRFIAAPHVEVESPTPTEEWVYEPIPTPSSLSSEKLMALVNDWRISQGFQPYSDSEFLCSVAKTRMLEVQINWSHEGFADRTNRFCVDCYLAENLARYYYSEKETLTGWLKSLSHKENLDNNYTHSCIVTDSNYVVHIFGYY